MASHAFNPSTQEAEVGGTLRTSMPAWFREQVLGQLEVHNLFWEILSQNKIKNRRYGDAHLHS